jgi:hypothetical protein
MAAEPVNKPASAKAAAVTTARRMVFTSRWEFILVNGINFSDCDDQLSVLNNG